MARNIEQYDKSDTDSDKEGVDIYDDRRTDTIDVQYRVIIL